jgi:hypothetical protein
MPHMMGFNFSSISGFVKSKNKILYLFSQKRQKYVLVSLFNSASLIWMHCGIFNSDQLRNLLYRGFILRIWTFGKLVLSYLESWKVNLALKIQNKFFTTLDKLNWNNLFLFSSKMHPSYILFTFSDNVCCWKNDKRAIIETLPVELAPHCLSWKSKQIKLQLPNVFKFDSCLPKVVVVVVIRESNLQIKVLPI